MSDTRPLLQNDALASSGLEKSEARTRTPAALIDPSILGVLREVESEARVSITPDAAALMIKDGYAVNVETGSGIQASFSDSMYTEVGCKLMSRSEVMQKSAVLFSINAPTQDFPSLSSKILVSWVGRNLPEGRKVVDEATAKDVTLIDVTAVPRITIAQKLDTLSSQAKVAGHRAVLEAAHYFGRFHQSEMTAAGKFPPSHTFILGCGVAGLAAIGTSRALGSIVRAWDVRDVHDQVESMGAKWVKVDFKEDGAGAGGYAKESSPAFMEAQKETFFKQVKECSIVITTAAIPGRASPMLITKDMVKAMRPGSVIVDLAAVGGGNCEMTRKDECYKTENGVTIIGYTDMPARMAPQSSSMYAMNMLQLLKHVHGKDKAAGFVRNLYGHLADAKGDVVSKSIVTCAKGKKVVAPPPPQVGPPPAAKEEKKKVVVANPSKDALVLAVVITLIILLILKVGEGTSVTLIRSFLLAGVAGYQAVWGVAHALHTPLMSVTNAISGMTAVGGLLLFNRVTSGTAQVLAYVAVVVSAVNIFGGFVITQRMLDLFRRPGDQDFSPIMIVPALALSTWAVLKPGDSDTTNTLASLCCIAAIACLASMKTANLGCKFGMMGMLGALCTSFTSLVGSELAIADVTYTVSTICYTVALSIIATVKFDDLKVKLIIALSIIASVAAFQLFFGESVMQALGFTSPFPLLLVALGLGGMNGLAIGGTVSPISLPQTVAGFHSLVGLAAMTTSIGSFYEKPEAGLTVVNIAACLGNFIGAITLTGSIIAFGKLNGNLKSTALSLPGKNILNLTMFGGFLALSTTLVLYGGEGANPGDVGKYCLWAIAVLACVMGLHLVASVGGGDMPVCVTVLNSYSGWALAAEGFNLNVPMLAIVGSIIGFSGGILTKIMCDAMNRDIFNVIFGGMNVAAPQKKGDTGPKEHTETNTESVAEMIASAREVVIVPGYGMAVARAQNPVGEVAKICREAGIKCKFAIHPVAGRMPGQMNVLLAEASVPYDWVEEMDEVNPDMEKVDVCLVMGANDITNSAAKEEEGCPIYGMPVIEVWRAKKVIFCKRSMAGGYADLENPVFFKENTCMLLGDAAKTASDLVGKLKDALKSSTA